MQVKNDQFTTGTVVRDCSGTYIRTEPGTDFQICNLSLLKDKKEGDKVSFYYEKTTNCNANKDKVVCMLYHENNGMITILRFK